MVDKLLDKEKSIETDQLIIKGNIMAWENTMVQLSNISCISTYSLSAISFPFWSIILIMGGLLLVNVNAMIAMFLMGIGVYMVYKWYVDCEKKKNEIYLNIVMNAGNTLSILFNDKNFLNSVLSILERIIIDGGIGKSNIHIDIKGNSFSGNAQVLNDLNLN